MRARATALDVPEVAAALAGGDRRALAKAITLIESTRADHREAAAALLARLPATSEETIRIGISGAPGVGKSTFIEAFGLHVIGHGKRLAVLTVDPSSRLSGGSILGDKTRMVELARHERAFIRPSPAGETLGGVARRTREAMLACAAAGFDVIVVETVGVGQSETAVAGMTDVFVVLLPPVGGDELQGIKRGIMELADLVLVNKADGEQLAQARRTVADYRNALRLLRPRSAGWSPVVESCSALTGAGIPEAWAQVLAHREAMAASGERARRRAGQARAWLWEEIAEQLLARLRADRAVARELARLEADVAAGRVPPPVAAREVLERFTGDVE